MLSILSSKSGTLCQKVSCGLMKEKLSGLATGIGSLPHKDEGEALNLIATSFPLFPHWPQLPQKGEKEGFSLQYLAPLLKFGLLNSNNGRTPFFCTDLSNWLSLLTQFYEHCFSIEEGEASLDLFAFSPESASGFYAFLNQWGKGDKGAKFVKGQISGPVSLGFAVTDSEGRASFYDDELRGILVEALTLHARWQVRLLHNLKAAPVLFIDDPGIYAYGQSNYIALSKESIQDSLRLLIDAIHAEGALAGIHCCAGVDWSLLFELPFDIVSFDAYTHFTSVQVCASSLVNFLENDGYLAWGIVPASEAVWKESSASLKKLWEQKISKLVKQGVPENLLYKQSLFTPSCGAGTLDRALSEQIYRLTAELGKRAGF